MIKSVFLYFLLFINFTNFAQKLKIKKGVILINKKEVGKVEKIKNENDSYYQITDNKGEKFCKVKETAVPSLLFKGDKEFKHRILYDDKIKDTLGIVKKNYWLNAKRSVEYLLIIDLLSDKGFKPEKINELVKNTEKYPEWILKEIENEEKLSKHINYKISRNVNDTIALKKLMPEETNGQLNRIPVTATKINIFQKNGEEEILIGYGLHEIESISGYTYYYIFNTKGVPLSFYDTYKYKIYYPYQEFGLTKNKLREIEGPKNIINEMALDLIKANTL